ncbi:MAG: CheR family methyltransferase [Cyclobacteriaceae bacterium]
MNEDVKQDASIENKNTTEDSTAIKKDLSKEAEQSNSDLEVIESKVRTVGIGASAGGIESLEIFFKHLSSSTGLAFVVIQHLDPKRKGLMREVIQRFTEMSVFTATDLTKVVSNTVYVIPPNKNIAILNGTLHLFDLASKEGLRLPIDYFFNSLANDNDKDGIGIILSGMGSDGSMGLKAIKTRGGYALVQSPSSCKYESMPQSAIKSVPADIVGPPEILAKKLLNIISHDRPSSILTTGLALDENAIEKIIVQIREQTGNDFSQYKKSTLQRRVERRMNIHQITNINNYVRFINENPSEAEILFKEILIGVTSFFRDPDIWKKLRESIIPTLLNQNQEKKVLRIWIPGCSTGEEAYSFAIILQEAIEDLGLKTRFTIQIFATDLDEQAVSVARKAKYASSIEQNVSPHLLKKYFITEGDRYRVKGEVRQMVIFAVHNVIKDPPFSKLDFLSCRNMLIYMQSGLQKNLMYLFHHSLLEKGILILGNSESINSLNELFIPIDAQSRIFKRGKFRRSSLDLFDLPSSYYKPATHENMKAPEKAAENLEVLTDKLLLKQLSPAGVLVNSQGDILYFIGSTASYLEPAVGKANLNVLSMAKENINTILPSAIRKAKKNFDKVNLHNVKVKRDKTTQLVAISVQQIEAPISLRGKFLILFNDEPKTRKKTGTSATEGNQNIVKISELEQELLEVNQELQNTTEEMQTSEEELKSTNEELQSTNEELQSTNEELTTSKDEMQSLNEELQKTNLQLKIKIDDAIRASSDMNNLLNSGELATLFLDKHLKIRHFTPYATKIFNLIPTDIGRPFTDISMGLSYPTMLADAKEVLRSLIFIERSVKNSQDDSWFKVRIMPYRTIDDRIDGLVITFINITSNKQLEQRLADAERVISFYTNNVSNVMIKLSPEWEIKELNEKAEEYFNIKSADFLKKDFFDTFCEESAQEKTKVEVEKLLKMALPNSVLAFSTISIFDKQKVNWNALKINDENGVVINIMLTIED